MQETSNNTTDTKGAAQAKKPEGLSFFGTNKADIQRINDLAQEYERTKDVKLLAQITDSKLDAMKQTVETELTNYLNGYGHPENKKDRAALENAYRANLAAVTQSAKGGTPTESVLNDDLGFVLLSFLAKYDSLRANLKQDRQSVKTEATAVAKVDISKLPKLELPKIKTRPDYTFKDWLNPTVEEVADMLYPHYDIPKARDPESHPQPSINDAMPAAAATALANKLGGKPGRNTPPAQPSSANHKTEANNTHKHTNSGSVDYPKKGAPNHQEAHQMSYTEKAAITHATLTPEVVNAIKDPKLKIVLDLIRKDNSPEGNVQLVIGLQRYLGVPIIDGVLGKGTLRAIQDHDKKYKPEAKKENPEVTQAINSLKNSQFVKSAELTPLLPELTRALEEKAGTNEGKKVLAILATPDTAERMQNLQTLKGYPYEPITQVPNYGQLGSQDFKNILSFLNGKPAPAAAPHKNAAPAAAPHKNAAPATAPQTPSAPASTQESKPDGSEITKTVNSLKDSKFVSKEDLAPLLPELTKALQDNAGTMQGKNVLRILNAPDTADRMYGLEALMGYSGIPVQNVPYDGYMNHQDLRALITYLKTGNTAEALKSAQQGAVEQNSADVHKTPAKPANTVDAVASRPSAPETRSIEDREKAFEGKLQGSLYTPTLQVKGKSADQVWLRKENGNWQYDIRDQSSMFSHPKPTWRNVTDFNPSKPVYEWEPQGRGKIVETSPMPKESVEALTELQQILKDKAAKNAVK